MTTLHTTNLQTWSVYDWENWQTFFHFPFQSFLCIQLSYTGELTYDRLKGIRKMGPSYAKSFMTCTGLGPSISSIISKSLSYSGLSYASSPVSYVFKCTIIHICSLCYDTRLVLMTECYKALLLTAHCLSPLPRFYSRQCM